MAQSLLWKRTKARRSDRIDSWASDLDRNKVTAYIYSDRQIVYLSLESGQKVGFVGFLHGRYVTLIESDIPPSPRGQKRCNRIGTKT